MGFERSARPPPLGSPPNPTILQILVKDFPDRGTFHQEMHLSAVKISPLRGKDDMKRY